MSADAPRFAAASVYVVTSGENGDSGVDGVFSTRARAEAWLATRGGHPDDDSRVLVLPLDDPAANAPDGAWHVVIDGRGAVLRATWINGQDPRQPAAHTDRGRPVAAAQLFAGYGPTREHARRSADALRRATIAGTVASEPRP